MNLERREMLPRFLDKFIESYYHYRDRVGLGKIHSLYRAAYYEIRHKEPYT